MTARCSHAHLSCSCVIKTLIEGRRGRNNSGLQWGSWDLSEARAWNSIRSLLYRAQIDLNLHQNKKFKLWIKLEVEPETHPPRTFRKWRRSNSPEQKLQINRSGKR